MFSTMVSTSARSLTIVLAAAVMSWGCNSTDAEPGTGGAGGSAGAGSGGSGLGGRSSAGGTAGSGGMAGGDQGGAGTGGLGAGGGGRPGEAGRGGSSSGAGQSGSAGSAGSPGSPAGGRMGSGGDASGGNGAAGGAGGSGTSVGRPSTFKVFDRIPMFGMYATSDPKFTPPDGVLMWTMGTVFVTKLTAAQQAQIGGDLAARITYHAQCDNYDRIGGVFFLSKAPGETPKVTDPRIELVRFITPFSDYTRGALATHVYPDADLAAYARVLADPSRDVWIGFQGGSNPYDGDPCTDAGVTPDFRAVGYKYSLDLVSTKTLVPGAATILSALSNVAATKVPVTGTFDSSGGGEISGVVTVIVSGHGADSGGHEYRNTTDTVTLNGTQIGSFSTKIDCAALEKDSPDGNPGIFRNNGGSNPRNWCPGALVPSHSFPAKLMMGSNAVSLGVNVSSVPSGSYYATSINFTSM